MASAILVTPSRKLGEAVAAEVERACAAARHCPGLRGHLWRGDHHGIP